MLHIKFRKYLISYGLISHHGSMPDVVLEKWPCRRVEFKVLRAPGYTLHSRACLASETHGQSHELPII